MYVGLMHDHDVWHGGHATTYEYKFLYAYMEKLSKDHLVMIEPKVFLFSVLLLFRDVTMGAETDGFLTLAVTGDTSV